MSNLSLVAASSLVGLAVCVSLQQRLGLEKDIITGAARAVVQLLAVGYVLNTVFSLKDWKFTTLMLLVMTGVAGFNAAKRGGRIPHAFLLVTAAIAAGSLLTLGVLLTVGVIRYEPWEVIPIGGMIIGNSMVACALVLNNLQGSVQGKILEIETLLSLGATSRQAADNILRSVLKAGMIPTVDSMKTLGIVQLPGMMTGLILGGASPLVAVRYQIMVAFMLISAVTVSCLMTAYLAYRQFFTAEHQLKLDLAVKGNK